jgi:ABC-2 type transport system ATP-binding protein
MADRIGVINKGEIILVEEKAELMRKLGKKQLTLQLQQKLHALPAELSAFKLSIGEDGSTLIYDYDTKAERTGVATLLGELSRAGLRIRDLQTKQSSLEDIFVGLVSNRQ